MVPGSTEDVKGLCIGKSLLKVTGEQFIINWLRRYSYGVGGVYYLNKNSELYG